jgi:hypothetical protein
MPITGHQLKAALSLAAMDADALGAASGESAATIAAMLARGAAPVDAPPPSLRAVVEALAAKGVEVSNDGSGVRLIAGDPTASVAVADLNAANDE